MAYHERDGQKDMMVGDVYTWMKSGIKSCNHSRRGYINIVIGTVIENIRKNNYYSDLMLGSFTDRKLKAYFKVSKIDNCYTLAKTFISSYFNTQVGFDPDSRRDIIVFDYTGARELKRLMSMLSGHSVGKLNFIITKSMEQILVELL